MKGLTDGEIATLAALAIGVLFLVAGIAGYVMNIVDLVGMSVSPITAELIVRVVGIFLPPVGAIAGYF